MPLKCRSCGHLNRDQAEACERCGCDLQYSLLFDTVIRNREDESRFLFPMDVPEGDEMEMIPEIDEDLYTGETAYSSNHDPKVKAPASPPGKSPPASVSRELQERASHMLVLATAELLLFMTFFMLLSMIAKITVPHLILANWKLAVVCLCYYSFVTVSSLYFTGETTASTLANAIIR
ncbi:MAG: hypothetical protein GXO70_09570 [Acidobacteria bacterium]|nr:hypothetical protein [Acidobacteriota bacterium]